MRTAHPSNHWLTGTMLLAVAAWALACGEQSTQPTIDGIEIRAAKGGNGNGGKDDVTVKDTDPPGAPQDTRLEVKVTGSGFDETSQVTMLLDEEPTDDITTKSTTFISSREVRADITIAPDATVDLFDVEVTAKSGGKRGIGIELFEVTEKSQECQFRADLTFDDVDGAGVLMPVRSDGLGIYQDGVDRVSIGTGSGDGFRFDTNGSQKIEANNDKRRVTLDFSDTLHPETNETDDDGEPIPKGIDLRFTGHEDGTRLNLCALQIGTADDVPVALSFKADDVPFKPSQGVNARLLYAGRLPEEVGGFDCGAQDDPYNLGSKVREVDVKRVADNTWKLASGPTACLVKNRDDSWVFEGVIEMPFSFTIVAQP